jgi:hypothetical protein
MISKQNKPTLNAHIESEEVLFVSDFNTGDKPSKVKKMRAADLTVLGILTSLD